MGHGTPFAQMPSTPEPIIAQVRRQLADDPVLGAPVEANLLDRVADRVVRELWESRVKTFVPVLALRQARELLRNQAVGIRIERLDVDSARHNQLVDPPRMDRPRNVLPGRGDVLPRDERDVFPL